MTFSSLCASVVNCNGQARRFAYFFATVFLGVCAFYVPLKTLIAMSLQSELYSYIPLIFVVSCYLLAGGRKKIFDKPALSFGYGAFLLILSLAAGAAGLKSAALLGADDWLCVMAFSFWLFLTGTFTLFFGTHTFKKAIFPLLLLLLTIPFPGLLLDRTVGFLQTASFTMTGLIFNVLGFFPLEQGFAFKFPEGTIEVATQCSGIRSSMALVILSLLCGHIFLRSNLNRILLVFFAVLIAIFKNGVRIAGLTLGGFYVAPSILAGPLHKSGGILVFMLGFALLSAVVMVMKKLEKKRAVNSE
jgi:exosortase